MQTELHSHYYQDGLIPVTPQARGYGYTMPVYISKSVWRTCILWSGPSRFKTNTDKRIMEVLHSCFHGMAKKLAAEEDFVFFQFKHMYWRSNKPKAKKPKKIKLGARLLLSPDDDSPWLLIFDPASDDETMLKKGENPNADTDDTDNVELPGSFDDVCSDQV